LRHDRSGSWVSRFPAAPIPILRHVPLLQLFRDQLFRFLLAELRAPERFRFFLSTGPSFPVAHGERTAIRGDVPEFSGFPVFVGEMFLHGKMVMT
jgi:hypothetical protein